MQPPVRLTADAPGDKRLGVDVAPIRKARHRIDAGNPFDIGRWIDRSEQSTALQVRGDDLRDGVCGVAVILTAGQKFRDRNRQRLEITLGNIQPDDGAGTPCHQRQCAG